MRAITLLHEVEWHGKQEIIVEDALHLLKVVSPNGGESYCMGLPLLFR